MEHLLTLGFAIVAQNIRIGSVEIDLIASHDNRICFVEVKTRASDFYDPLDAVDSRKRSRMVRAADSYMQQFDIPLEPQFDLLFVVGTPDSYTVEYIPDAFFPTIDNKY